VVLRTAAAALLCFAATWAYEAPYHPCDGNSPGWVSYVILVLPTVAAIVFALPGVKSRTSIAVGVASSIAIALAIGIEQSRDEPFGRPGGSQCEFYPVVSAFFALFISLFVLTVVLSLLNALGIGRGHSR
jgi:hypothetical protein